jgi:chromate transporter
VLLVTVLATQLRGHSLIAHCVERAALGASTAVPAIALWSAVTIVKGPFRTGVAEIPARHYVVLTVMGFCGALASSVVNPVITLLAIAAIYAGFRRVAPTGRLVGMAATGSPAWSLWWMALKVGALSFGGGFVIVPLMRADVIHQQWMAPGLFASAVALGQITPGPVVATVAAIGVLRGGVSAGLVSAVIAFAPSFVFIATLSPHFSRLRASLTGRVVTGSLGAGAAGMIGAAGVLMAIAERRWWQLVASALCLVAGKKIPFLALLALGASVGLLFH